MVFVNARTRGVLEAETGRVRKRGCKVLVWGLTLVSSVFLNVSLPNHPETLSVMQKILVNSGPAPVSQLLQSLVRALESTAVGLSFRGIWEKLSAAPAVAEEGTRVRQQEGATYHMGPTSALDSLGHCWMVPPDAGSRHQRPVGSHLLTHLVPDDLHWGWQLFILGEERE